MKKALCLLLCAVLLLSFSGCFGTADTSGSSTSLAIDGPYKLCAAYPSLGNSYYAVLNSAVESIVEGNGDRLIILDAGDDQAVQTEKIEDMLTEGIDVMILAPVDADGVLPALKALQQRAVPVVNVGVAVVETSLVDCVVISQLENGATLCAGDATRHLPAGGGVLVLANPGSEAETTIAEAFAVGLGDGFSIGQLDVAPAQDSARQAVNTYWENEPTGASLIFAASDAAALGAIQALQGRGMREGAVLVYATGGTPEAKRQVSEGWLTALAAESPSTLGTRAANAAYQLLNGNQPTQTQRVPVDLITAENAAEFPMDSWN